MSDLSFRQRAAQQATVQRQARTAQDDVRRPFSAAMGSVSIALRACVGRPCYVGPDGVERRTSGDQIVVALSMSNARGAAPISYAGWADTNAEAGQPVLSDDLGHRYVRAATSRGLERWVGQVSGARTVGPGETLADVLVFAAVDPRAKRLTLELPRATWGLTGALRVDLPVARIENFPVRAQ